MAYSLFHFEAYKSFRNIRCMLWTIFAIIGHWTNLGLALLGIQCQNCYSEFRHGSRLWNVTKYSSNIRFVVEAGRGKVLVTFCFEKFCAGLWVVSLFGCQRAFLELWAHWEWLLIGAWCQVLNASTRGDSKSMVWAFPLKVSSFSNCKSPSFVHV